MTYPNPVLPRLTYAVSRRCAGRCYFLRPSRVTNQVLGYCLGYAQLKYPSIRISAFAFLSTHYHLLTSDTGADLASFYRDLNALIARAMNRQLGRGESLWASGGLPRTGIFDMEALWEQLVYATLNPTKDGLVEKPEDWPGLISLPEDVGTRTFRFERPQAFFRHEGDEVLPAVVTVRLEAPVELEDMELEAFRREYRRRLDAAVAEVHRVRAAEGKGFLGPRLVRDMHPLRSAGDVVPERGLSPRVACKDRERRRGVLRWLSEFRAAHRAAWQRWSQGDRTALFPFGTYLMRLKHGARCRDPGATCELLLNVA